MWRLSRNLEFDTRKWSDTEQQNLRWYLELSDDENVQKINRLDPDERAEIFSFGNNCGVSIAVTSSRNCGPSDSIRKEFYQLYATDRIDAEDLKHIENIRAGKTGYEGEDIEYRHYLDVAQTGGDLSEVRAIVVRDGKSIWLETGDDGSGWQKIEGKHVRGRITSGGDPTFFELGQRVVIDGNTKQMDSLLSGTSELEELIVKAAKYGKQDKRDPAAFEWTPNNHDFQIRVVVSEDGWIVTAYPNSDGVPIYRGSTNSWG